MCTVNNNMESAVGSPHVHCNNNMESAVGSPHVHCE